MLNNYAKLKAWIEKNVPKEGMGNPTVARAAIWFVCLQEAGWMHDGTHKDMAEIVESGLPPLNTTKAVTNWLQEQYQVDEDEIEEVTKGLESNLREHFGI